MMTRKDLLACDLDGTLLVPARSARPDDIPVETVRGETRSYLPRAVAAGLEELSGRVRAVPVTSRSVEQYLRIAWPDGCRPEYAVVANGGILLRDGAPVGWPAVLPDPGDLDRIVAGLVPYGGISRAVDGRYSYLHAPPGLDPGSVSADVPSGYRAFRAGRKFYFLPPGIDKETALGYLRAMFRPPLAFAAGDGEMDLGMLAAADVAVVPAGGIGGRAPAGVIAAPGDRRFSEFIVETLLKYY